MLGVHFLHISDSAGLGYFNILQFENMSISEVRNNFFSVQRTAVESLSTREYSRKCDSCEGENSPSKTEDSLHSILVLGTVVVLLRQTSVEWRGPMTRNKICSVIRLEVEVRWSPCGVFILIGTVLKEYLKNVPGTPPGRSYLSSSFSGRHLSEGWRNFFEESLSKSGSSQIHGRHHGLSNEQRWQLHPLSSICGK